MCVFICVCASLCLYLHLCVRMCVCACVCVFKFCAQSVLKFRFTCGRIFLCLDPSQMTLLGCDQPNIAPGPTHSHGARNDGGSHICSNSRGPSALGTPLPRSISADSAHGMGEDCFKTGLLFCPRFFLCALAVRMGCGQSRDVSFLNGCRRYGGGRCSSGGGKA